MYNGSESPLFQAWIQFHFKNDHTYLKTSDGAFFYGLGSKTKNRRLKSQI